MPTPLWKYADIAARYGVDRDDEVAVGNFFAQTLPTLSASEQSVILDELLLAADAAGSAEWLLLTKPRYQAAILVFKALQTLGDYPEGAPDYDAEAVAHLRAALASLTPDFGNMETLGAPRPSKPVRVEVPELPPPPTWVASVLAEEMQQQCEAPQDVRAPTPMPHTLADLLRPCRDCGDVNCMVVGHERSSRFDGRGSEH